MQKLLVEVVMFFCKIRPRETEDLPTENLPDGQLELIDDKWRDGFIVTISNGWTFSMDRSRKAGDRDIPFYHLHVPVDHIERQIGATHSGQVNFIYGSEAIDLFNKVIDALLAA